MLQELQPHQQRVVDEKLSLDDKIIKLQAFTDSDRFTSVDPAEQDRLFEQLHVMRHYSRILGDRIQAFSTQEH